MGGSQSEDAEDYDGGDGGDTGDGNRVEDPTQNIVGGTPHNFTDGFFMPGPPK